MCNYNKKNGEGTTQEQSHVGDSQASIARQGTEYRERVVLQSRLSN
jgi:hypothetical protein